MAMFWVVSMLTLVSAHACPSVCVCFSDVPSVHCNHPTLEHIPQGIPNTTTTLQMKGTRLVSVRRGDLAGLPLLRTLYLFDNQVQRIEVGAFDNNPDIQSFAIGTNSISEVLPGIFRGMNSLREIDMRGNKITSIPAGVFNGLPRLRVVRLFGNQISTLAVGAFSNLSSVALFCLESNRIARIENGVFGSPQGATSMMLISNNISVIEPGALSSFVSMSRLWINSNRLSTLQGVFEGLQEMTQIYAQDNDISALNEGDFSGLTKLREIRLNNNRISTIAGRVFADLSSLQTLYLQDNEISVIGNYTFHGLFNLRNLYMSGNKLETITGGVFANLYNLYSLGINNNKLLRMEARLPLGLRFLFLQSNVLTEIPTMSMGQIHQLDLSFNPIDTVRNEDLLALRSVSNLAMSGIKYFRDRRDIEPDVFAGLDKIASLALANNSLTRVPTSALRHAWRLVNLDLSANAFTALEYGDFDNLTNIQDLDLSGNKLTTVPREALANLSSLRSLILSDNPIVYVGSRAFGPQLIEVKLQNTKLRVIDGAAFNNSPNVNRLTLSNNYLQYLPETVFQPLTYYGDYETLDLDGNPWVCDCQLAGYSAWLKAPQAVAIPDLYCTAPPSLAGDPLRRVPTNWLNCSCVTEESPRIDTRGSTTSAAAGDKAILRCKVTACPGAAVLWTTPRGMSLTSDSEFPNMHVQTDGTLVIATVTTEDAGLYTCMAVNAFGTAEARVVLKVTRGPTSQAVGIHHFVWNFNIVLLFPWYISGIDT
ncbi:leucine-rich repeat-containing protein 4C-like isoform X4 [Branchiostoma floridae]|uniref:Leucine-rich repeat-containing protein 4C-like isoform X4 n=1 Tax=Branchiostoma floridae TaxID=7739 RepID=A0A9J7K879_BRAFL|nr:leucine-rich repeat-containing protein 4C-like isoform X4 [Branchiostoma floridae]